MAVQVEDHKPWNAPPAWSTLDISSAAGWAERWDLPAFRAKQLIDALDKQAVQNIEEFVPFPGALRERMRAVAPTRTVTKALHLYSRRDGSEKALLRLFDGLTVEAVLIPSGGSSRVRYTVCVSSQVGCPAACTFCATGLQGFTRNLTAAEIVDQVLYFVPSLRERGAHVTNVVFMGMGEPFLNAGNVRSAVDRLTNPKGFNLGARHITISTVGILPQMLRFADWAGQVNLAVSLHAPNDELRSSLVPYNQYFPIDGIMDATRTYIERTNRRVSFEYVLLRGVNDSEELAAQLAALLNPLGGMVHVNIIPWNPFREGKFVRSEGPDADAFAAHLRKRQINATIRYSKGLDISAACGQLREREAAAD